MAKLSEIVIDAIHPARLARFWSSVLDESDVRSYDQIEIDRLAKLGLTSETDPSVALNGPAPTWFFQPFNESKASRNRIHLDIVCDSTEREVERLQGLGATVRDVHDTYTVMLDPEGNEFRVKKS